MCHLLQINMSSFMITAGCETTLEAKVIWRLFIKEKKIHINPTESMHQFEADSKNSNKTFVMVNWSSSFRIERFVLSFNLNCLKRSTISQVSALPLPSYTISFLLVKRNDLMAFYKDTFFSSTHRRDLSSLTWPTFAVDFSAMPPLQKHLNALPTSQFTRAHFSQPSDF